MRIPTVVLALCALPAVAHAQGRLDLSETPDPGIYEAVWPLPYARLKGPQVVGSFGLGFGTVGDDRGATATSHVTAGIDNETFTVVARSELTGFGPAADHLELQRGRHEALALLHVGGDLGFVLSLGGVVEHGDARGLAPLRLSGGRRTTGDATAEAQMMFDPDHDESFAFSVRGTAGGTRWASGAAANRLGLGLAFGYAPNDHELPRGMLDFIHARVEHTALGSSRALAATTGALGSDEVRRVEVGLGAHEMTLNIDHELAAVINADFGWSWLQADTPAGQLAIDMFRMQLGVGATWRARHTRLTHVGLGIGREPDHTADGSRLVKDWRLEMSGGVESRRLVLAARGGISWLIRAAGGAPEDTLLRYGAELEGFVKVGAGLEVGAYHATHYEAAPGDPWGSRREWSSEYGAMLRIRTDLTTRLTPVTPAIAY